MPSVFASGGYPEACRRGHPWGPGRITINWSPCEKHLAGHHHVYCRPPEGGCGEVWTDPPCVKERSEEKWPGTQTVP